MPLAAHCLPLTSILDNAEDPPESIDPLGTSVIAEKLAEILFPGMTLRMWRIRLLTYTALAALIAERAAEKVGDDSRKQELRLAFERIYVSALVRNRLKGGLPAQATQRLPGSLRAQQAFEEEDLPLSKNNFLVGQAVNGPFGVMARLAQAVEIIGKEDELLHRGEDLLAAWAQDQNLPGLFQERNNGGASWRNKLVEATTEYWQNNAWRSQNWSGWNEMATYLRLDQIGRQERERLIALLESNSIRKRMLGLLQQKNLVQSYQLHGEPTVFEVLLQHLDDKRHPEDVVIHRTVHLINAFEKVASLMQCGFDFLRYVLTEANGQLSEENILNHNGLAATFDHLVVALPQAGQALLGELQNPDTRVLPDHAILLDLLAEICNGAMGCTDRRALLHTLMQRHARVQERKNKGVWIEMGKSWFLMPGFAYKSQNPPEISEKYSHRFRIENAYSFLEDLGLVRLKRHG
ncbi:MAG: hypothetical protein NZL89_06450 [Leptospiraceae bacterium]|nr:hypothetical protein [Leptospiraceae bacterium]